MKDDLESAFKRATDKSQSHNISRDIFSFDINPGPYKSSFAWVNGFHISEILAKTFPLATIMMYLGKVLKYFVLTSRLAPIPKLCRYLRLIPPQGEILVWTMKAENKFWLPLGSQLSTDDTCVRDLASEASCRCRQLWLIFCITIRVDQS